MTHTYPPFDTLGIAPDFLLIGRSAMCGLASYGWLETRPTPPNVPSGLFETRPRKPYQSVYVGVTKRYTGYTGAWAPEPGKYVRGPVRATELEAAQDRARALGRDYLEARQMSQEARSATEPEPRDR